MSAGDRVVQMRDDRRAARDAANRAKAARAGRDDGHWVAWLAPVQQSPGWRRASHTARSLLMDMLHTGPNGKLLATLEKLEPWGWTSADTLYRAVNSLMTCGLLVRTRDGARPNRAAWYACTWLKLRHVEGLDINPRTFKTGGYMTPEAAPPVAQRRRTAAATAARQMNAIVRANGYKVTPSDGGIHPPAYTVRRSHRQPVPPSDGAMRPEAPQSTPPLDGEHLGIAICVSRPDAARTLLGKMLRRARPTSWPTGYHSARARLAAAQPECMAMKIHPRRIRVDGTGVVGEPAHAERLPFADAPASMAGAW